MKKFSKLILETKKELWTKHPLVNPVDWDEIFKPLIEHIDSNLKDKFSNRTKLALDNLIGSITKDYVEYYINNEDDGSQESFFNAYSINTNRQDVLDCLQQLSDRTNEIEDYPQWDCGYYVFVFSIKYKDLDELIEDIEDVHLKLKVLKVNYAIRISTGSYITMILESNKNISQTIRNNIVAFNVYSGIKVIIFNKDTIQINEI